MNSNLAGTITFVLGFILTLASALGCTTVGDTTTCTDAWVPAPYNTWLGVAVSAIGVILKFFKPGGTVVEKLTNPSVVVVPPDKAGPGTVTPAQVAAK